MTVVVRFAPSPTGRLHVGNARTALINWLFAHVHGGRFLLRFDDTDIARSESIYADAIEQDLAWLGLDWRAVDCFRQSDRLSLYAEAAGRLKAQARLYPCYETAEELALKRKAQAARHQPPVYDRAALALTAAERARLEAEGRRPHWRFLLERGRVEWHDLVRGPAAVDTASLSDPVLIREDGVPLYTLASVVDDIDRAVSHVIRGEDHVTNTAPQIQLFIALGGAVPAFAHLALMVGREGESLSKRLGSLSLEALRQDGIEPMALASLLARLGSAKPVVAMPTLEALAEDFSLDGFGRAPAHFDPDELRALSARIVHAMDYASARPRLDALGLNRADQRFWLAVRGNLTRIEDARDWWQVCQGPLTPIIEDREFTAAAALLLPPAPLDELSWSSWTARIAAQTGRKGRALYHPLRLALTGRERGPELGHLLPLIGHERALRRLRGEAV